MPTLTAENRSCLESENDRPADAAPTAEQRQRWAASRAATVTAACLRRPDQADLIRQREAARRAKPTPATFVLASPNWTTSFAVDGDTVTVTHANRDRRLSEPPQKLTLESARALWLELIDAGMWRW